VEYTTIWNDDNLYDGRSNSRVIGSWVGKVEGEMQWIFPLVSLRPTTFTVSFTARRINMLDAVQKSGGWLPKSIIFPLIQNTHIAHIYTHSCTHIIYVWCVIHTHIHMLKYSHDKWYSKIILREVLFLFLFYFATISWI